MHLKIEKYLGLFSEYLYSINIFSISMQCDALPIGIDGSQFTDSCLH